MDEIEKWQRSRKKHKNGCKWSRFLDIDIPVTAWPNTNTRNTRVNYKTIMESIPTCDSMSDRKVLRGAGIVGIFAKVRFQPWREIWSFYHLKIWGSFCDTFGWTWHEQSFYTNLDMIIFESGISSPLSSMYGIWPLLPNFMVNTFSYLHIVMSING